MYPGNSFSIWGAMQILSNSSTTTMENTAAFGLRPGLMSKSSYKNTLLCIQLYNNQLSIFRSAFQSCYGFECQSSRNRFSLFACNLTINNVKTAHPWPRPWWGQRLNLNSFRVSHPSYTRLQVSSMSRDPRFTERIHSAYSGPQWGQTQSRSQRSDWSGQSLLLLFVSKDALFLLLLGPSHVGPFRGETFQLWKVRTDLHD